MTDVEEKLEELLRPWLAHLSLAAANDLIANGVTVQEWIPVTERLPEEDERYIVTACDEQCSYGDGIWYKTVAVEAEYYKGEWVWDENGTEYDITCFVTHWMPIPRPPKGE